MSHTDRVVTHKKNVTETYEYTSKDDKVVELSRKITLYKNVKPYAGDDVGNKIQSWRK